MVAWLILALACVASPTRRDGFSADNATATTLDEYGSGGGAVMSRLLTSLEKVQNLTRSAAQRSMKDASQLTSADNSTMSRIAERKASFARVAMGLEAAAASLSRQNETLATENAVLRAAKANLERAREQRRLLEYEQHALAGERDFTLRTGKERIDALESGHFRALGALGQSNAILANVTATLKTTAALAARELDNAQAHVDESESDAAESGAQKSQLAAKLAEVADTLADHNANLDATRARVKSLLSDYDAAALRADTNAKQLQKLVHDSVDVVAVSAKRIANASANTAAYGAALRRLAISSDLNKLLSSVRQSLHVVCRRFEEQEQTNAILRGKIVQQREQLNRLGINVRFAQKSTRNWARDAAILQRRHQTSLLGMYKSEAKRRAKQEQMEDDEAIRTAFAQANRARRELERTEAVSRVAQREAAVLRAERQRAKATRLAQDELRRHHSLSSREDITRRLTALQRVENMLDRVDRGALELPTGHGQPLNVAKASMREQSLPLPPPPEVFEAGEGGVGPLASDADAEDEPHLENTNQHTSPNVSNSDVSTQSVPMLFTPRDTTPNDPDSPNYISEPVRQALQELGGDPINLINPPMRQETMELTFCDETGMKEDSSLQDRLGDNPSVAEILRAGGTADDLIALLGGGSYKVTRCYKD